MGELLYIFEYSVCASATYVQIQLAGIVNVLTIFSIAVSRMSVLTFLLSSFQHYKQNICELNLRLDGCFPPTPSTSVGSVAA